MTTEQMRAALRTVYISPNWAEKVGKMSDRQVFALYTKFLNEGKIKGES